jgi:2-iminobutanoate/2-iminopropanoate deaminase
MELVNPKDCPPQNPSYSQAAVSGGTVWVAGQIGIDPTSGHLVSDDVAEQTERIFRSARAILAAAGTGLDRVVRVAVFLVDLDDWAAMNDVYGRHFAGHAPPKSTVVVRELALGARVEIEFVAVT